MKKFILLAGAVVGFFIGSGVGRGPYEQLAATIRRLCDREEVRRIVETARSPVTRKGADAWVNAASADDSVADKMEDATPTDLVADASSGAVVDLHSGEPGAGE